MTTTITRFCTSFSEIIGAPALQIQVIGFDARTDVAQMRDFQVREKNGFKVTGDPQTERMMSDVDFLTANC